MILVLFICTLFRGNGKDPSIIGVTKCQPADHILQAILIISGFLFTVIASVWGRKEYVYRQKIGYKTFIGNIEMTMDAILKLALTGFVSGFLVAGFGVGPAFVLAPSLLLFKQHPASVSATGQYIAMLNCLSATIVVTIF